MDCPFCYSSDIEEPKDDSVWRQCLACKHSFTVNATPGKWGDFIIDPDDPVLLEIHESEGQKLEVRVGPVFISDGVNAVPGIWIGYQEKYMQSDLHGPVLLSPETWVVLRDYIDAKLAQFDSREYGPK